MSNNKPVKGPGGRGAAFRSGPMVENPEKMLKRLLAYVFRNYRVHIILVVIGIVVSVLANVQGTMFMKTLIDQYIMPLLKSDTPDFHPPCHGNFESCLFLCCGCWLYLSVQPPDDLCQSGYLAKSQKRNVCTYGDTSG